jgi:sensor histidine kinase YesM
MILQPFVENAIWHGISPKKNEPGHIRISFRIESGELICEVTDDGVGRKAASGAVKKHESKALSITHRRLALLGNEAALPKPTCTIHDEVDEAGLPAGTRVRLHFPIA